jgi:hypothetical protein
MRVPMGEERIRRFGKCASHHCDRRVLVSLATTLLTALPLSTPLPARADDVLPISCSYEKLQALPGVLSKVTLLSAGDAKIAKSEFKADPLLADPERLSKAFESCAADAKATEALPKAYEALQEEFRYQTSKSYDARWPDLDDQADLQSSVKRLKLVVERSLASVPPAQRGGN